MTELGQPSLLVNEQLVECILRVGKIIGTFDGTVPDEALRSLILMSVVNKDPNMQAMIDLVEVVVNTLLGGDMGHHAAATMALVARSGEAKHFQLAIPGHGNWEIICRKVEAPTKPKPKPKTKEATKLIYVRRPGL